ncbi:MAG TPA: thioredoxin family protein [Bacteroidales bacterium]
MKRLIVFLSISILAITAALSQGYNVGDRASDFKLKNVDGKLVSLSNFPAAKGFVVVFTCNHCPFAKAYQDRIIQIDQKYKPEGYPVIAINPNDPTVEPEDSFDNMILRAKEKKFSFPYLFDETQAVYRQYGAKRTPHIFLLQKQGNDLVVKYIGAIDDNSQDASKVTNTYLANAIDNLLAGRVPDPATTKAIGCSIKDKQAQP